MIQPDTVMAMFLKTLVKPGHALAHPGSWVVWRLFVPNSVLVVATEADLEGAFGQRLPWVREKRTPDGSATAYVCERGACQLPTSDHRSATERDATPREPGLQARSLDRGTRV